MALSGHISHKTRGLSEPNCTISGQLIAESCTPQLLIKNGKVVSNAGNY